MDYVIKYKALKNGAVIKQGRYKAKNMPNKAIAQIRFEDFLKKKYKIDKLLVYDIWDDNPIFDMFFKNVFK